MKINEPYLKLTGLEPASFRIDPEPNLNRQIRDKVKNLTTTAKKETVLNILFYDEEIKICVTAH